MNQSSSDLIRVERPSTIFRGAKVACAILSTVVMAATVAAKEPLPRKAENVSVRNEVALAAAKGLSWLESQQKEDGSWSSNEHPALTALALLAFQRDPTRQRGKETAFLRKGFDFLRRNAKPDGGIYGQGLSNYNTSLALTALLTSGERGDEPLIEKARAFIVGQQAGGMANPALDGGIGYGPTGVSSKRQHPDLDNTVVSLEALQSFRSSFPTKEIPPSADLNWKAAIDFITRCQNLPSHNPSASNDPKDKGGFVYYPGFSNADPTDLPAGAKKPLRSYGSMSYAGLLSFIYAGLNKDDPRISSAIDWLKKNYTLEENPGIGAQGLFYHYHLMAKALATAGIHELQTEDGRRIEWSRELGLKLINLQKADGSWINDASARWMEKDPVLVTSYCVMALEIIYREL